MAHWHYAHQAHHRTYFSQPYFVTFCQKKFGHTNYSLGWMIQMLGIYIPNYLDTRFANIRASECKDKARFVFALASTNETEGKSSCICKSPITRRYLSFSFSIAASSTLGASNATAELSMNSFFQRLIITGETSYFTASSLRVSRSLMASKATLALNFASYFFCSFHGC